jgi:hypothetical protein
VIDDEVGRDLGVAMNQNLTPSAFTTNREFGQAP